MQINLEEGESTFFFEAVPCKHLEDKEVKEFLLKWGLADTLRLASFRFNQPFQDPQRMLIDLLNSPNVRFLINNISYPHEAVSTVKSQKVKCRQLTMKMFDRLQQAGITKNGSIAKMLSQDFEGIQICDHLRQCLIQRESENYGVFEEEREEFLFKLFTLLAIGGSLNQYQDVIAPYLQLTRKIYKSLLSVRKKPEGGEIYIETEVYEISEMEKGYKKGFNPQNCLYVLINPSLRVVHVLSNLWQKYW